MSPKRVLITGAYGFVGSHILDQFLSIDVSVRAVVGSEAEEETLRNKFPRTSSAQLDFAIVPDEDLSVPGAYDDALSATPVPFDTVVHTISANPSEEEDCFSHFVNLESDSKRALLESVNAVAPKVRRVIVTSSLHSFATWLAASEVRRTTRSTISSIQSVAATDPEYLLATCRASVDLVNDRLWKFIQNERPRFDLVALCAPSVCGPSIRPLRSLADLEEGNQRAWSMCNSFTIPPDGMLYYTDVRDFAFAHVQAALIPQAGNRRFVISAGTMPSQAVSDIVLKHFPELADRVTPPSPVNPIRSEMLSSALVDSTPATVMLGLVRYRSVDETLTDLAKQLVELEQKVRGIGNGRG
ncbi:NAD(P)-binding protein [Lepidopterella palustris CBS 459.81]|uniref:NAD(P)-binding protein n=1 Tax=Lepidopterella palustris CBS 459.81 TaxID=1314670 RepID=A0A8E2J947_9PEZI|nr:NAD(P)-binding protein [Lepidopterella palustris CBS 459.81]